MRGFPSRRGSGAALAAAAALKITPTGEMYAFGRDLTDTQAYTSLAGITFPVGSVT